MEEYTKTTDMPGDKARSLLPELWQEACHRGGRLSFRVISGSMEPIICVGDKVGVTRAEPSRLRIGDIIAFREDQKVMAHRIIGRGRKNGQLSFRLRGDEGVVSGRATLENLIGKVYAIERDGHEIRLDTPRYVITNSIMGWRLRIKDSLVRTQHQRIGTSLRLALIPVWRLCRRLLLWRL